jgi:hypothetical protein
MPRRSQRFEKLNPGTFVRCIDRFRGPKSAFSESMWG